jgi:hypothetical protein
MFFFFFQGNFLKESFDLIVIVFPKIVLVALDLNIELLNPLFFRFFHSGFGFS